MDKLYTITMNTISFTNNQQVLYPVGQERDSITITAHLQVDAFTGVLVKSRYRVEINWISNTKRKVVFTSDTWHACLAFIPEYVENTYGPGWIEWYYVVRNADNHDDVLSSGVQDRSRCFGDPLEAMAGGEKDARRFPIATTVEVHYRTATTTGCRV